LISWVRSNYFAKHIPHLIFSDVGCGTGCIGLALSHMYLKLRKASDGIAIRCVGIDSNPIAVNLAQRNAQKVFAGAANKHYLSVHSTYRDYLQEHCRYTPALFDLIVSNPPYIPTRDIAQLDPEVRDYESHSALDGGEDGMDMVRGIDDNHIVSLPNWLFYRNHLHLTRASEVGRGS
jgi:release factor glutamine methyltransferase